MMKKGAAAVMALASISGAAAQTCATDFQHCVGPEPGDNTLCCPTARCIRKNIHYAQCIPNDMPIPSNWTNGELIPERSPSTFDMMADFPAEAPLFGPGEMAGGNATEPLPVMDGMPPVDDEPVTNNTTMMGSVDDMPVDEFEYDGYGTEYDSDGQEYDSEGPVMAAPVSYMAFVGRDYHPNLPTSGSVAVMDVPNGNFAVTSPQQCEELCTQTPQCNAASYYLDASAYNGFNCWLKTLEDVCDLPADAAFDDNAVYLIQVDDSCFEDEALAPGSLDALGPISADAPVGDMLDALSPSGIELEDATEDPATAPFAPGSTPRGLGNSPSVPISPSGDGTSAAVSVRGAIAALAVAGAAAFF